MNAPGITITTHLQDKTHKEVECSQSQEENSELHIPEVVKLESLSNKRAGINHQPRHHGDEEQHQAEENPCGATGIQKCQYERRQSCTPGAPAGSLTVVVERFLVGVTFGDHHSHDDVLETR